MVLRLWIAILTTMGIALDMSTCPNKLFLLPLKKKKKKLFLLVTLVTTYISTLLIYTIYTSRLKKFKKEPLQLFHREKFTLRHLGVSNRLNKPRSPLYIYTHTSSNTKDPHFLYLSLSQLARSPRVFHP